MMKDEKRSFLLHLIGIRSIYFLQFSLCLISLGFFLAGINFRVHFPLVPKIVIPKNWGEFFNFLSDFFPLYDENAFFQGAKSSFGTIGVSGFFVNILIGSVERPICGVRTGELIDWNYKYYFHVYVCAFLPTVLIGIFASSMGNLPSTIVALVGVLIWMGFSIRVFFKVALVATSREKLAFQYYYYHISRRSNKSRTELVHQKMLSAADYLHEQVIRYHQDVSNKMVQLWLKSYWIFLKQIEKENDFDAFSKIYLRNSSNSDWIKLCYINNKGDFNEKISNFKYPETYVSDGQDTIIKFAFFSSEIWAELLEKDMKEEIPQEVLRLTRPLFINLYNISQGGNTQKLLYFAVLLGLLIYLDDYLPNRLSLIEAVNSITNDSEYIKDLKFVKKTLANENFNDAPLSMVRKDFLWALLMLLTVGWLDSENEKTQISENALCIKYFQKELVGFVADMDWFKMLGGLKLIDRSKVSRRSKVTGKLKTIHRLKKSNNQNVLLWYTEWIARLRANMPLDLYILRLSFATENQSGNWGINLSDFSHRKDVLINIIYQLSLKNEGKDPNDDED